MRRLTLEILKKGLCSMTVVVMAVISVPALGELGDSLSQSVVVLSFYVYCFIVLFSASPDKLFHVLSIPFLAQFIHIFQRYSFPAGANSLWWLLPFLLLNTYLIRFLTTRTSFTSRTQKCFVCTWIVMQSLFLVRSPQLEAIIGWNHHLSLYHSAVFPVFPACVSGNRF